MATSESQKKATLKYLSEKVDDIRLRVPKGMKAVYQEEARKRGQNLTQFIIKCIEESIK